MRVSHSRIAVAAILALLLGAWCAVVADARLPGVASVISAEPTASTATVCEAPEEDDVEEGRLLAGALPTAPSLDPATSGGSFPRHTGAGTASGRRWRATSRGPPRSRTPPLAGVPA